MQSLPEGGGMLAAFAPEADLRDVCAGEPLVGIAATNAADETVLSGNQTALDRIAGRLAAQGIRSKTLRVSHAFHSPLMTPIADRFAAMVAGFQLNPAQLPVISNLTGRIAGEEISTVAYWKQHVVAPVRFIESLTTLAGIEPTHAIELGPAPVLTGLASRSHLPRQTVWLPSLRPRRGEASQLFEAVAALYVAGLTIDWQAIDSGLRRRRVTLPSYPFRRQRCWVSEPPIASNELVAAPAAAAPIHPVLGSRLPDVAAVTGATIWQIDAEQLRSGVWHDHAIDGVAIPTAAASSHLAYAAAREAFATADVRIDRLELISIQDVDAAAITGVQVMLTPFGDAAAECRIFVRDGATSWRRVADARVAPMAAATLKSRAALDFGVMFFNGSEDEGGRDHYQLVLQAARFADRHGFSSVWAPERHYTAFGGLYPNPAVLHAALARETRHVRLMAGSHVTPLHHPLRAAEDWALVDNLSNGRVGRVPRVRVEPGRFRDGAAGLYRPPRGSVSAARRAAPPMARRGDRC